MVWFGESLVPEIVDRAVEWAGASDAALVVGTSALVQPAASLPLLVRGGGFTPVERNHGHPRAPGCILEVNTQRTPLSARADVHIPGPAGLVLPALLSGAPAPS